jgi:MinD-like ATPase involved in chromosome partitioning or flagellar assembly
MLKAIVFGTSPQSVRYMCQMCAEMPDLVVIRSLETLPMPHSLTRILNSFAPQLVLLEASAADQSRDLAQDMLDFHADIPLIAFRMKPPESTDWVPASMGILTLEVPISGEQFQEALFRAMNRGPSTGTQGRLIAFLPAKGGSGATTLSLGAATLLAQKMQKRVLFLECDVNSGPVATYLALQPASSIVDVLEDAQLLNLRPFSQLVTRHQELDILPSIGRRPTHRLSAWSCQRLISRARGTYDFVFCDLPDTIDEAFEPVLRAADQVVLVTTPSEAARFLVERRLNTLSQLGVGNTRISLVVNRVRPAEQVFRNVRQVPISATVPNRSLLWDVSHCDLTRMIGSGIERQLTSIAEICAGQPLSSGSQRRKFSLASIWSSVGLGLDRSRDAGAKG